MQRYQIGFAPVVAISFALMMTERAPMWLAVPVIGSVEKTRALPPYLIIAASRPIPGLIITSRFFLPK